MHGWKRPLRLARALPTRPLRQAGLPSPGAAPHPPGPGSCPARSAPLLSPPELFRRPTLPFPAPTAGTAPAPPTPAPPGRRALPGGDCRSPSAIFQPPGARPDACRPLTFHFRTHPSFPRAQSFLKRNEHRPAITENQELKSPHWRRPPCLCGALREHAQQRPARCGRAHWEAAAMLVRGTRAHAHQRTARPLT